MFQDLNGFIIQQKLQMWLRMPTEDILKTNPFQMDLTFKYYTETVMHLLAGTVDSRVQGCLPPAMIRSVSCGRII